MRSLWTKLGVILLIIGLTIFCAEVCRAGDSWVLWEEAHYSKNPKIGWRIVGAYPDFSSCQEEELFICKVGETEGNHGCRIESGGHYFILRTADGGYVTYHWKCLPESVDPRK